MKKIVSLLVIFSLCFFIIGCGKEEEPIDIDNEPELAQKYGVMSIPTFIKFSGGAEEARTVGAIPKSILLEQLGLE
ncbi:MAG: thioredoxin family protein [Firmicutes bacterium]|nr:thioredoxin family protein [Bacillota bacterium]